MNLEQRIAAALTGDGVTAAQLLALAGETDAAITAADETAKAERERALDPALSPDPRKARQAAEDAEFSAARLATVLPRIRALYQQVVAQEDAVRWAAEYRKVAAETDALAQELTALYVPFVPKLVDLMTRIAQNDEARSRVARAAAAGEPRRVRSAEQLARGSFSVGRASLAAQLQLPDWQENRLAWPPARPTIASVFAASFDRRTTDDWWRGPIDPREIVAGEVVPGTAT